MVTIGSCGVRDPLMSGSKLALSCIEYDRNVQTGGTLEARIVLYRQNIVFPTNPGYCTVLGAPGRRAQVRMTVEGVDGIATATDCIFTESLNEQWFDLSLDIPESVTPGEAVVSFSFAQPESGDRLFDDAPPSEYGTTASALYARTTIHGDDQPPGGAANDPPNAAFSYALEGQDLTITNESSDPDGQITAYNWSITELDGTVMLGAAVENPTFDLSVLPPGQYQIRLTVTDDDGDVDVATESFEWQGAADTPDDTRGSPPYALAAALGLYAYSKRDGGGS